MPSATEAAADACRRWRHFQHEADIGLEGCGATLAAAFEETARALTAVVTGPEGVRPQQEVRVEARAPDAELLLVDWLNALVYEMATRRMLFSRFQVTIEGGRLAGRAWGEPVDVERHQPAVEVKGATYTALRVARGDDGCWCARCVVDV